jgi:hypothetical protein
VASGFDGTVSFESQQAPATSYRRKTLFSSINVGGGLTAVLPVVRIVPGAEADRT